MFKIIDLESVRQGHDVNAVAQFDDFLSDGKNIVCLFQNLVVKIATCKVWHWKYRSSSRSTTFAVDHLKANINLNKSRNWAFLLALTVCEILSFEMVDLWNYVKVTEYNIRNVRDSMAKINLYKKSYFGIYRSRPEHSNRLPGAPLLRNVLTAQAAFEKYCIKSSPSESNFYR